jgi:hypothetical protein
MRRSPDSITAPINFVGGKQGRQADRLGLASRQRPSYTGGVVVRAFTPMFTLGMSRGGLNSRNARIYWFGEVAERLKAAVC